MIWSHDTLAIARALALHNDKVLCADGTLQEKHYEKYVPLTALYSTVMGTTQHLLQHHTLL